MPPLTDPTCITVIATCAFLTVAAIVVTIKAAADLRKFRDNLKPGDYANIELDDKMYRGKLIRFEHPFYSFREINTRKVIVCIKSKIYLP